jgi:two-component system NtrC family sensor kinase
VQVPADNSGSNGAASGAPAAPRRRRLPARLGAAAAQLLWLPPRAASLRALARPVGAELWQVIRTDPGAVLLLLREAAAARTLPLYLPALLHDPAILVGAQHYLNEPWFGFRRAGSVDAGLGDINWQQPDWQRAYQASLRYAATAALLAERSGRCDPDSAWCCGLLAPLGWLAVALTDPSGVHRVLAELQQPGSAASVQQAQWGFDCAAIARRLARRWRLPDWLGVIVGSLDLPLDSAQRLGADPGLFQVVQLAVGMVQGAGESPLQLRVGAELADLAKALGLSPAEWAHLPAMAAAPAGTSDEIAAASLPLLRELLSLAAENRRLRQHGAGGVGTEAALDELHRALAQQRDSEAERLQGQKLCALAEFAAGAGHEINNPLAVLSGQAQYLLKKVTDGEWRVVSEEVSGALVPRETAAVEALGTIIQQSLRIHQTLRDLMQFARPPQPRPQRINLLDAVREVITALGDLAAQREVDLRCTFGDSGQLALPIWLEADPGQVRTMLLCLLRNAIEAAPATGWASIRLESPTAEAVDILVEDSGPGLAAAQQEHLFDPFYSGRQAGRGRGLGLSTAWRLARLHGGEVRFVPLVNGPTRFAITLPRAVEEKPAPHVNGHTPNLPKAG